jgi:predicted RNA-binding Zn-ribbon protein involved in translation (DUF1610 family)
MAKLPVVKEFQLKQAKLSKKFRVEFECPDCGGDLVIQEAELTDQQESCPNCGLLFLMSPEAARQIQAHHDEPIRKQREQEEWQAQEDRLAAREEEEAREEQERRQVAEREKEAKEQAKKKILKKKQREAEREKEELAGITGKWEDRYKNLARYLVLIKTWTQIICTLLGAIYGFAGFIMTARAFDAGSYQMAGFFALFTVTTLAIFAIGYLCLMAAIEYVYMQCNLEQETVISRLALQKLVKHFL